MRPMDLTLCPEITYLQQLIDTHGMQVRIKEKDLFATAGLTRIELQISEQGYTLLVADLYEDLDEQNQPLCLLLAIRALVAYQAGADYGEWMKSLDIRTSNSDLHQYYMQLGYTHYRIESLLGRIASPLKPLDYLLGSGPMKKLRQLKKQKLQYNSI